MLNQNKNTFPGLNNMTVAEVRVMAKVCRSEGDSPENISEIINCVDDCLSILKSASIINRMRGKRKWNQQSARDIVAQRILQLDI
ncbi:hypothetical protein DW228_06620 [Bacteroides fragilis]|uniref:Uncharacterized protein n=1 Tax=Bacteroides fragilis TaxID=817 RepID=A0A396C1M0_BACFG|nr:hypothetical protein [Bacteroides fragilis]RHH14469.1 hypothetical protein DW228_06620 [Bacteroides fragilis]